MNDLFKIDSDLASLTKYVSTFSSELQDSQIPLEVDSLGKKSILDAIGAALSGSISEPNPIL
jgi:hypothetical protein